MFLNNMFIKNYYHQVLRDCFLVMSCLTNYVQVLYWHNRCHVIATDMSSDMRLYVMRNVCSVCRYINTSSHFAGQLFRKGRV